MKKGIFIAGVVSVGLLAMATASNAAGIKEGQWSMTMVIQMAGADEESAKAMKEMENMSPEDKAMMEQMMGGMGMKMGAAGGGMGITTTMTQCLTNDNPVPKAENEEDCKQTHTKRGNTVNFEVVCDDSHSTGKVTYKNDSMQGTINSTTIEKGVQKNTTINVSGEYVGPCDENASVSAPEKARTAAKKRIPSNDEPEPENSGKAKKVFGGLKALMGQ